MTRLFLPPEKLAEKQIIISGNEARYLSLVLRVKPGESLIIFDGGGYRYTCKILTVHKKEVLIEKIKKEPYSAESSVSITLAQGLPKSDKMDLIVQKSTELGVRKIIPLITERSQVRHTEKIERWRKIALSASQQCGREKIPEIEEPVEFREFLNDIYVENKNAANVIPVKTGIQKGKELDSCFRRNDGKKGIIFFEEQKENNLKKVLTNLRDSKNITLLIGPEGGFSGKEVTAAVKNGFIEASLGPRILRTETAPITAISIIQYELGDIGG
ncbi:MAG: 16S rRNA (uracil(1498)-N(3))-methyltransferase [Nitrospirae bacterium]|nr:16S rRNA (uracil(1498)-N(3))-methyltransferase [Nitrospirota bacterium]